VRSSEKSGSTHKLQKTYFPDTTPKGISLGTSSSQPLDTQHYIVVFICIIVLIWIEKYDGLKTIMKQGVM